MEAARVLVAIEATMVRAGARSRLFSTWSRQQGWKEICADLRPRETESELRANRTRAVRV